MVAIAVATTVAVIRVAGPGCDLGQLAHGVVVARLTGTRERDDVSGSQHTGRSRRRFHELRQPNARLRRVRGRNRRANRVGSVAQRQRARHVQTSAEHVQAVGATYARRVTAARARSRLQRARDRLPVIGQAGGHIANGYVEHGQIDGAVGQPGGVVGVRRPVGVRGAAAVQLGGAVVEVGAVAEAGAPELAGLVD